VTVPISKTFGMLMDFGNKKKLSFKYFQNIFLSAGRWTGFSDMVVCGR